jgi:mannosyltransferase
VTAATTPTRRTALRAVAVLTLAGAVLRFATLDLQSFWYDEAVTVGLVRMDLWGMLGQIPSSESTPPLYYVLAWLWTKPFGSGEIGLRSLSALLGTCSIPVFYAAARELAGSVRVGVATAALGAFNPFLVWYSQEARTYALLGLLGALSLYLFARLLREPDRGALVGWAVVSALALTAHYFAAFVVLPEALWLLARGRQRRALAIAVAGVGAVGLALLPLALHQQSLDLASFIRSSSLPYRLVRSLKQLLVGFEAPLEVLLTIVGGVIALAGALLALRRPAPGVRAACAIAAAGIAIPFVLALVGFDYLDTRNVILVWLPAATVAAAGLARSRAGVVGVAAVCAIGLASTIGVFLTPLWQRDNWRGAAEALGPARVPRAVVVTPAVTGVPPFRLYAPGSESFPKGSQLVQEVALVSKQARELEQIHPPPPPRPADPRLPGFPNVRRRYAENYTLIVFSSPRPVPVYFALLNAHRLLPGEAAGVLLQRP